VSFNLCVDLLCRAAGQEVPREPVVWTLPSEILRQLRADPRGAALPGSLGIALEELLAAHAKLAALEAPIKAVCDAFGRGCTAAVMGDAQDIRAASGKIVDAAGRLHGAAKRLSDPRVTRETVPEDLGERVWGGDTIELGPKAPEPPRPLARASLEDYAGEPLWYVWLDLTPEGTWRVANGLTEEHAVDLADKINARGAEQKVKP